MTDQGERRIYPTTDEEIAAAREAGTLPLLIPVRDGLRMVAVIDFRAGDILVKDYGRGWSPAVRVSGERGIARYSLRTWRVVDGDVAAAMRVLESHGFVPNRDTVRQLDSDLPAWGQTWLVDVTHGDPTAKPGAES